MGFYGIGSEFHRLYLDVKGVASPSHCRGVILLEGYGEQMLKTLAGCIVPPLDLGPIIDEVRDQLWKEI